ncbi:hypothetical protein OJF2_46860 [Aquisphaera giovannonii]|uniref:Uncharacterized protein n=1 Tax=Aquisphaera giovannonii TaxID=406548 RepID=A0A5B9W623_9BACT|nr:hypothetical protein [Aquisphaera giovannonii]QEH36126.1 hypothetical protein OJF2_46860 [Aquisphaera giovannonii]
MNADVIGYDRNDEPFLIVEVDVSVHDDIRFDRFVARFLDMQPPLPFGIYADLEWITLLGRDGEEGAMPLCRLDARTMLGRYDPDFRGKHSTYGTKLIFGDYLTTLVEVWLQDLAFHWKSEEPPGSSELAGTEFLRRLEGGMTKRDVTVGIAPLH